MYTIQQLAISLGVGVILGLLFGLIAFALRRFTRPLLFIGLVIAAVAYVLFAILLSREAPLWLVVELVGLCIYGTMGMLGWRGSPWWLVAGWGLHSLWTLCSITSGRDAHSYLHWVIRSHVSALIWWSPVSSRIRSPAGRTPPSNPCYKERLHNGELLFDDETWK